MIRITFLFVGGQESHKSVLHPGETKLACTLPIFECLLPGNKFVLVLVLCSVCLGYAFNTYKLF